VLVELSVMEQRYQAVLAVVQDGWQVTEVTHRLGVSRQSVHAWIARYRRGGLVCLADRSHRPSSCPHQIPPQTEALICELRRKHPGWGPRRIEHQLARAGLDPVPSRSSVYRCLRRHGLIELRRRRKRRKEFRRFERDRHFDGDLRGLVPAPKAVPTTPTRRARRRLDPSKASGPGRISETRMHKSWATPAPSGSPLPRRSR
jgi:transposase